jgi:hypothetical protein
MLTVKKQCAAFKNLCFTQMIKSNLFLEDFTALFLSKKKENSVGTFFKIISMYLAKSEGIIDRKRSNGSNQR